MFIREKEKPFRFNQVLSLYIKVERAFRKLVTIGLSCDIS